MLGLHLASRFVVVANEVLDNDALAGWMDQARSFAASLPAKSR
ncbi:MAG TPA: hypothetical protein VGX25_09675 [Actinophytocola sp.]|nr:hypothetical protein [Actinophytocola sp.]HEV2779656.1 hypothetical protein [Actinophytocola sp.]